MSATFEERQTHMNIAVRLFQLAVLDQYDKAIIVSGHIDLLPAVRVVQSKFPSKQIGVVIPICGTSEDMKKQADFDCRMKEKHLHSSLYPENLTLTDGSVVQRPKNWI